jgi:hypothetical protein
MYQSKIDQGFFFQQTVWVNNIGFIFGKNITDIGLDMVIGQPEDFSGVRSASGFDPTNFNKVFTQNQTVISNGGEYFFTPSISALNNTILA